MPRNVVASTYITLDGYIDEPGRWSFPFWSDGLSQFKARELFASDAQLLGRVTSPKRFASSSRRMVATC